MILLIVRYWFPIRGKFGKVNTNLTWTLIFAFGLYTFGNALTANFEEVEKEEAETEIVEFIQCEKEIDEEQELLKADEKTNCDFTDSPLFLFQNTTPKKQQFIKLYLLYCQLAIDKKQLGFSSSTG